MHSQPPLLAADVIDSLGQTLPSLSYMKWWEGALGAARAGFQLQPCHRQLVEGLELILQ